jgi:hypothetical protein
MTFSTSKSTSVETHKRMFADRAERFETLAAGRGAGATGMACNRFCVTCISAIHGGHIHAFSKRSTLSANGSKDPFCTLPSTA